jgi:hypothetical protein
MRDLMKLKIHGDITPILELEPLPKSVRRPKATEAEARALDQKVIQTLEVMRSSWLRLGSLIQKVIDTRAFEPLGFRTMKDWMDARLGKSMSTAYSALRSVRALKGIPEQKLERIPERNAYHLTRLPETERQSDRWVEKAATLPTKEFKDEVETELERKTGLAREEFRAFSVALPEPVYDSLCAAEEKIAGALIIDIETKPGSRILVWEALAQWILQTDEETIKIQTEGS